MKHKIQQQRTEAVIIAAIEGKVAQSIDSVANTLTSNPGEEMDTIRVEIRMTKKAANDTKIMLVT